MRVSALAVVGVFVFGLGIAPSSAVQNQPDRTHFCNLDVDIVLDLSTSMDSTAGGGMTRIQVAKQGATTFLNGLSPIKDRSAFIGFSNPNAHIRYNGFTSSHATTVSNVNAASTIGNTYPTSALQDSHNLFLSQGRPDARWMMIYLSDGDPSDAGTALPAATAAKASGVEIISIMAYAGSGGFQQSIASDPKPDYFKSATTSAQVQQAWNEISAAVFKICASFEYDAKCHHLPVMFEDKSLSPYSNDPIVDAYWDMGDGTTYGPNAPLTTFWHKYAAPGTYNVTLRVVTQSGIEAVRWAHVYVCNNAPELSLGADMHYYVRAGYPLFFHVTVSDANGDPTRVNLFAGLLPRMDWDPVDKAFLWRTTDTDVGVYELYFEAVDYRWIGILPTANLTAEAKVTIHVIPPDQYPVAADDEDGDGVSDLVDNCPGVFNPGQEDISGQGLPCATGSGTTSPVDARRPGMVHDPAPDADGDGIADALDNCPTVSNSDQADADGDGVGDMCQLPTDRIEDDGPDVDLDFDGIMDRRDNCPGIPNPFQRDRDGDGLGDECDTDLDGDGVPQLGPDGLAWDNCPYTRNPDQFDSDGDGIGDACQNDEDGDGIPTYVAGIRLDNCPTVPNPDQKDSDGDGIGDACQTTQAAAAAATAATPTASLTPWVIAGGVGLLLLAAIALVLLVRPRTSSRSARNRY